MKKEVKKKIEVESSERFNMLSNWLNLYYLETGADLSVFEPFIKWATAKDVEIKIEDVGRTKKTGK